MERSNNVTASCYCNSFFHKDYLCCTSKFSKTLGYQPNKCHFSKLLLPGASFNLHRQLFSFLKLYCKFYIHKPYSLLALLLALLTFPLLLVTQESRIVCTNTRELHPVMSKSHIQIFLGDRTKCKGRWILSYYVKIAACIFAPQLWEFYSKEMCSKVYNCGSHVWSWNNRGRISSVTIFQIYGSVQTLPTFHYLNRIQNGFRKCGTCLNDNKW